MCPLGFFTPFILKPLDRKRDGKRKIEKTENIERVREIAIEGGSQIVSID